MGSATEQLFIFLILLVTIMGAMKFITTPKESFPDVVLHNSVYSDSVCGNSPKIWRIWLPNLLKNKLRNEWSED